MTDQAFTYNDYMNKACTHRQYYAQFVSCDTIDSVVRRIGADRIIASTDEYFNDIPLAEWDRLGFSMACSFASRGVSSTLASKVCVAKEAARQYKEISANT